MAELRRAHPRHPAAGPDRPRPARRPGRARRLRRRAGDRRRSAGRPAARPRSRTPPTSSVAEALTNVARHSGATSARRDRPPAPRRAGRGGQRQRPRRRRPSRGSGLTGLADRAAVADGRMLLSSPPGGPTVLRVELPCPDPIRVVLAEDAVLLRRAWPAADRLGSSPSPPSTEHASGPGHHRHPDAADVHRRGAAGRRRAAPRPSPRWPSSSLSQYVQHSYCRRPARLRRRPRRRLPAQGPGRRRRGVHRRAAPRRRRRDGGRPPGHQPARYAAAATRWPRCRPREREVLALIAEGHSNAAIARQRPAWSPRPPSASTSATSWPKLRLPQTDDTNRRVLAVLAYLRDDGREPRR